MEDTEERRTFAKAELEVLCRMAELPVIRLFVRKFCTDLPHPFSCPETIAQLELAITEAVANIVEHACGGQSNGSIRIVVEASGDSIALHIHHCGKSFDPSATLPPSFDGSRDGGFGLYMMNQCVDEVSYLQDESGKSYTRLVKRWL